MILCEKRWAGALMCRGDASSSAFDDFFVLLFFLVSVREEDVGELVFRFLLFIRCVVLVFFFGGSTGDDAF